MDQVDSIPANNTAQVTINVRGLDIEVQKAVSDAAPTEGDTITYTITVNNLSSQTATAINISDIVPNGTTYVAASIAGGDARNDATPDTTGLTWTVNTLAGGASATLTFQATVDLGAISLNPITNSANLVSIAESEDNSANNIGTVDINAVAFDIAVTKAASASTVEEGQTFTYTITVENTSSAPGADIVISDIVPAGVTYVASSIAGGNSRSDADPTGAGLSWTVDALAPGATADLTFDVTVDAGAQASFPTIDNTCLLYTSPSPRDQRGSRMPSSA